MVRERPELGVISRVSAWRMTEPAAKFPREMRVIAKATGVGDVADSMARAQKFAATQKACGVIQTKRIDKFAAGRGAPGKELLQITLRNTRFGRHFARTEIWIGKAILDDAADAPEEPFRMRGVGYRIRRSE